MSHPPTPIIYRTAEGTEHDALRTSDGEILIDCRRDIANLVQTLTIATQPDYKLPDSIEPTRRDGVNLDQPAFLRISRN